MDNPLAEQQREKKGAETFGKYQYQYHWAFKKLLDEHKKKKEYAIFVEFHEDVVFADSLRKETAEFEFYQIKENSSSSKYTVSNLTKVKPGSKNSILGKLIDSYQGKTFKEVISSACLVSTSGFSKEMVKGELELDEISPEDLKVRSLAEFKKSILKELDLEECPVNIRFIVSKLLPSSDREAVIAAISDLISSLYPNSQCDAINIYRTLIDELHRKGQVTYDYSRWGTLIEQKALTSETVQKVIEAHSSIKGFDELERLAVDLISDLNMKFSLRQKMLKSVRGYYTRKVSNNSGLFIRFGESVRELYYRYQHFETADLVQEIENALPDDIKKNISNQHELRAAVICEVVVGEI